MPPKQASLFDFFEKPDEQPIAVSMPSATIDTALDAPPIKIVFSETDVVTKPVAIPTINKSARGRKKLTNTQYVDEEINIPDDEALFQKNYYAIGVVAQMFKVNISLIRYWEKEFDILKPKLNGKGDRHFRPEDVKNLQLIHHLIRQKKYTLEGAKTFLKNIKKSEEVFVVIEELQKTKLFLTELKLSL